MASIELKKLHKSFDETVVLTDVNFRVEEGEFVVLVGPSGCGKSTILRTIAGLETPTSGDVFIGNRRVNDVPSRDRDIAMVFQSYALYPHLTVYDNMAFRSADAKNSEGRYRRTRSRSRRVFRTIRSPPA